MFTPQHQDSRRLNDLLYEFRRGQCNFPNFSCPKSQLQTAFLPFINLTASDFRQSDFRHAVLAASEFGGANLEGANFEHANLLGANLKAANLQQANLNHSLLASASLQGACLRGANLSGARLADVNLQGADLRNTNLIDANLKNANLARANLFGARYSPHTLKEANLQATIMPDGAHHSHRPETQLNFDKLSNSLERLLQVNDPRPSQRPASAYGLHGEEIASLADQDSFLHEIMALDETQSIEASINNSARSKYIGFQLRGDNGALTLEIVEDLSNQDGQFICANHFLQ